MSEVHVNSYFSVLRQMGRTALLEQMREKDTANKNKMVEKIKESDFAISYDRICLQQDKEDRINKEKYLQQFRNENKRVITAFNYFLLCWFNSGVKNWMNDIYHENKNTSVYKTNFKTDFVFLADGAACRATEKWPRNKAPGGAQSALSKSYKLE